MIEFNNVNVVILDENDFQGLERKPTDMSSEAETRTLTADIVIYKDVVIKNRFSVKENTSA